MRIDDNTAVNVYKTGSSGATSGVDFTSRGENINGPEGAGSDQVDLSGATNLVALARQAASPERQARVSGVIAQVQAGQYQVDPPLVGQALVQGHLSG